MVRGFLRGNNANNNVLSPLAMNGNNTPSNSNSNIAFGKNCVKIKISPDVSATIWKADAEPGWYESRTSNDKMLRASADRTVYTDKEEEEMIKKQYNID